MRKRIAISLSVAIAAACATAVQAETPDLSNKEASFTEVIVVEPDSQNEAESPATPIKEEKVFVVVEQEAQFPGGQSALYKWIGTNLCYPAAAVENYIQGRVIVKIVVEKDGSITNPVIVKGVDKDLDREALNLVKKMPKWQPGMNNGVAVRSYFYLPITFKLQ